MLVRSAARLVLSPAGFVIPSDESRQRVGITRAPQNIGIVGGVMEPGPIHLLTETHEHRFLLGKDGESRGSVRCFIGNTLRFHSHDPLAFGLPFSTLTPLPQQSTHGILSLSSGSGILFSACIASRFGNSLLALLGKPGVGEFDEVFGKVLGEDAWCRLGLLRLDRSCLDKSPR